MGTMEKLFVQVFERKKWIEQQVKRHTLLFDQQLASKCLIDGIAPPPWLFSSPPNELNKEELISGLLLPCPPLAVNYSGNCYSTYYKPTVPADHGDLPDSFFTEVHTSYKGFDAGDRLSVSPQLPVNEVGGASNGIQKGDSSAAVLLPDLGVERLSDVSPEPAQLMENFQRSKSRQRALALRNSAKLVGSILREENNAGTLASGITGSEIATLQHDHVQELELLESVDTSKEIWKVEEGKLGEFKGMGNESQVEKLIFPLILGPQPETSHSSCECIPCYKPAVIFENEELANASNKEVHTSSKGLVVEDALSNLHQFTVNDSGFVSNGVFEVDFSAESPHDHRSPGTSDIDSEPLESLERVQRSKSRQRALEVRKSSKAGKRCLSRENDICVYSSVVNGCDITSLQSDLICKSESINTAHFDNQSRDVVGEKACDYRNKEKSGDIYSGRITRFQSFVQQSSFMTESSNAGILSFGGRSSGYNNEGCPESSKQQIEESAFLGWDFDSGMVGSSPQLKQRKDEGGPTATVSATPSLKKDEVVQSNETRSSLEKMQYANQLVTEGSTSSPVGISPIQPGQIHESELVTTADYDNESCQVGGSKVDDFQIKEKSSNIYSGRITRSRTSGRQTRTKRESSHAGEVVYAGRSWSGKNVGCIESSEPQIEENSGFLGKGFCSVMMGSSPHFSNKKGSSPQLKLRNVGGGLTDAIPASPSLRDEDVVQSNKDRSPVDKMDHVEQLVTKVSKPSPIGISSLECNQIHESELVKTTDFENESFEVEGAKGNDFRSKEKYSKIYSGMINRSQSSVRQPGFMRESSHAGCHAYAGRSSMDDGNVRCPESREQQIEESSASSERVFGSGMVCSSPQLEQVKFGGRLSCIMSAAPSLRDIDVVPSSGEKIPIDKMENVEQLVTEVSKSSTVGVSSLQPEPVYDLELRKTVDAHSDSCVEKEANLGDIQSKENNCNAGSDRITRSQTPIQQRSSTRDSLNAERSSSEDNIASSSESRLKSGKKSILPGNNYSRGAEDSLPQHKRRKVDVHLNGHLSGSRIVREEVFARSGVNKSTVVEMDQNGDCKQEFQSSHKLQVEEDNPYSEKRDISVKNTHFTFAQELEVPSVSSCINQATGDPKACSDAEAAVSSRTMAILDSDKQCYMGGNEVLLHLDDKYNSGNREHLSYAERSMNEGKCHLGGNGKFSQCSIGSPQRQTMEMIGTDQHMPEFEEFILGTDNEHSCSVGEDINFEKLDLPKTTIERAVMLEKLCKSACMHTPFSHFSTTYKLHRGPNSYQSVPNGLLECIDLSINHSMNDNMVNQLKACYRFCNEEANHAFQARSYPDCLPFSSAQRALDVSKPLGSPIGNFWDRITSNSAISEKRGTLNPELPCISEENGNTEGISSEVASPVGDLWDCAASNSSSLEKRVNLNLELPLISEEDENIDMVAGIHQGISSKVLPSSVKREPFADITKNLNLPASVSEADAIAARSSLESVETEFSFSGNCKKAKQKHERHTSNKKKHTMLAKMSHGSSLGENGINRAGHSRFSKTKLSGKLCLRKGGPSIADRETKHNNIVSNVTSFIPLVQQKQAAGIIAGKRDVKVKALEAAEAAKRLAEEKENERKVKKEALKLERAKLVQEKMKRLELQKKNKEEERKKKEADMAARKRQREEEEKRDKERKRKRVVEGRKQQQEKEEKLHAKKEADLLMDERINLTKVPKDEIWRDDKRVKEGEENLEKMLKTEYKATVVSTRDARDSSIVVQVCDPSADGGDKSKATSHLGNATARDLVTKQDQEQSYDISPYKDSEDEEEEDNGRPNTKFIPSWASKRGSALVLSSLLRSVNPEVIFPPASFCSISEVLLPRRQQPNRKL